MKKIILLPLFITTISAYAQSRIYVNEYLNIGVGAEALSLGGAVTASTNNVYAGYWNPAGLMQIENDVEIGLMHAEYFAGIFKYDYGALAIPINNRKQVLGLSFFRFATDNIPYTLDYVRPDGSFDESQLKGFSAGDYALNLSYAMSLNKNDSSAWNTNVGANAKIIYRNVGSMANAWGFGLDIGLQTTFNNRLRLGIMLKDITTTYTSWQFNFTEREKEIFYNTGNDVPIKSYEQMMPRINVGVGYHLLKNSSPFNIYPEIGFDITTDGKRNTLISGNKISIDPKMGITASYKNTIYLRGGISNIYSATDNSDTTNTSKYWGFQPSVGVGLNVKALTIDYAFTSLRMQDNPLMSHIVSLKLNINRNEKKSTEPVEIISPNPTNE